MNFVFWLLFLLPVILFIFIRIILKRVEKTRAEKLINRIGEENIVLISSNVNYFGKKSDGIKQIKGNGILILTYEELIFEMWLPKKSFKIPLMSVESMETSKSHLGKTKFRPLLKINFRNNENEIDTCAFLVANLEKWKEKLQSLKEK